MESGDLRVFQAVANEGSITKAAAKLNYVQSNVTARIQQLETDLQTVLFYRHNRGMTLTSSGKSLLTYADKILGLLEEAAQAVTSSSEPRGTLAIGSTQTSAAVRLPKLLASYHKRYPEVEITLTTENSIPMEERILRYEVDGAFLAGPVEHEDLLAIPAFDEEMVIVSDAGVDRLMDAAPKPVLVFAGRCYYRQMMEKWLKANAWSKLRMMEFGTLEAIIGGVEAGLGISMLARSVVAKKAEEGTLRIHELPAPDRRLRTSFVMRKDAFVSRPLQLLLEELEAARDLNLISNAS
ncbi:LysR family transcriptional regulator [Cohnella lubricantis]|uniref:LysR family transcriptional regulator n=1 Tax=Cohnella lubricantis TaxID=2163172 RepID=A0A841TCN3_9BACL|nr:LysR family transcriptional regulator [Cohnella lubricantis]MBB6676737.1 LysR family transcriptional regulator [Cohnella lubricantis]MBP2117783.1 DNA-binding transcriptional LysR family regulator [Cohnella lubricantis]